MNRFESVTDGTASHSTWLPNDGNQVAGYKPLRWLMALLLVAFVAGCGNGGGGRDPILGGGGVGVALAPTVTSTVPANLDTGVQINRSITATFSELMNPATITGVSPASFKVTGPLATAVPGTVTYAGLTAVFTPTSALAANSPYTATVTTVVKNQAGVAMVANFAWSFTTGLAADTTRPTVISTDVLDGTTGLPVNRNSTATFSEPMDPSTLVSTLVSPSPSYTVCSTGALQGGACVGANVAGVVTYLGNTATFNPNVDLSPNTWYKSTISAAATDLAFNPLIGGLIPNPWNWQTGAVADIIPPTITSTNPANLPAAAGLGLIPITQTINATFSEAMSPATMVTANFTVKETVSLANVPGTVAYDVASNIASFLPQTSLTPDTSYTATVSIGAKDLANNALVAGAVPNPWTFRTAPVAVPPVPLAINLGSASTYGIASQAGMTSSGVTTVNGDIALWPLATCTDSTSLIGGGAAGNCTAFKTWNTSPTGMTVNGSIYYAGGPDNLIAQQVTNDLNTAWIQGKNKIDTTAVGFLGGQLGGVGPVGKTITPGVYEEATTLNLAAGWVATFDGVNDPNAVFIIKVGTTFTDSGIGVNPSQIKLTRGAQAKNIWFITGVAANIGTGTIWNGNILAGGTITISGGSTVTGRLLAGAAGAGAFTMTTTPPAAPITVTVP